MADIHRPNGCPHASHTGWSPGRPDAHDGGMLVLQEIEDIASTQNGVVTAAQCWAAGLSQEQVRVLCRSRRWLRLSIGAYYTAVHDGQAPRVAHIQAAILSAGPSAVAVLQSAAELHGLAGARQSDDIHINLPGVKARDRRVTEYRLRIHQMPIPPTQVTIARGIPVTTPARTAADLVLRSDRLHGVAILDSALYQKLIAPEDLDLVRAMMAGRRGAADARSWFDEVDGRAESPLESRVRLRASDGGLPPDELQYPIYRDGRLVGRTDLAWLRLAVIGEADEKVFHGRPEAVFEDRWRQNAIVGAAFLPVRFAWSDTLGRDYVPRAIREAAAAARRLGLTPTMDRPDQVLR
jgi:predicted transcriptional regulator of viral defense system